MKLRPTATRIAGAKGTAHPRAGFTLVEVLAALLFMAIVIPTAVHGVRVASMAGELGIRKAVAARVADRELNELLVTRQWHNASPSGTVIEGAIPYRWSMRTEPWNPATATVSGGVGTVTAANVLRLLTVEVSFPLQGQDFRLHISTVVDPSLQFP